MDTHKLIQACKKGDLLTVKKLLKKKSVDLRYYHNAIWAAIEYGYFSIVRYIIINKNLDITHGNNFAIKIASQYNRLEIAEYLIKRGADVNGNEGWSIVMAAKNGYIRIVKLLVKNGADINVKGGLAIKSAMRNDHRDIVEYLESITKGV